MESDSSVPCQLCGHLMSQDMNFCPECGAKQITSNKVDLEDDETLRASLRESDRIHMANVARRDFTFRRIGIAIVVGVIVIFGFTVFSTLSSSDYSGSTPAPSSSTKSWATSTPKATATDDWLPPGYEALTSSIGYKKVENPDCGYSSAHICYQAFVVSKFQCKLFLSVDFLVDNVVVDDSIDSVSVGPNQKSIVTFVSFDAARYDGSTKIRFTDASCY